MRLEKILRGKLALTLLAIAMATLTLASTADSSTAFNTSARWAKIYDLYEKLVELYRQGGEASNATTALAKAIELLEACETSQCLARVDRLLNTTAKLLEEVEKMLPKTQLIHTLTLAVKAGILLSLPIAAYILLPRIIAWEWYLTRRRWLVARRGGKRVER